MIQPLYNEKNKTQHVECNMENQNSVTGDFSKNGYISKNKEILIRGGK